ncbi:MAG TPA: citryl-CoA lyase [Vicinamibacterales bacterium]|nr:citryl-CoA lyase [Vicinamibacterales bacterium]
METWRSAIVDAGPDHIRVRGRDVLELMRSATFTDLIFLLHHARLPTEAERRLIDAILIGSADHGAGAPSCAAARLAASGNRQSPSAAIAAGVLTIGDEHGGAGSSCMEMIVAALERARRDGMSLDEVARHVVDDARAAKARLPGFGHRVHATVDPRVDVLFGLAEEGGLAGDGIRCVRALEQAIGERIKPLPINIDGALAAILVDLGFPPLMGVLLFVVARVAGISAEVLEEHLREKPMRIRIPVAYDGEPPQSMANG